VILIVTNRADHTADWLVLELERRSAPFFRFNTEDFPSATFLDWTPDEARLVMSADRRLELRDVQSVWYRRPLPLTLPPGARPSGRAGRSARLARH
jgi:hypothetical protein